MQLFDAHYVRHGKEAWEQIRDWFEETSPRLSLQIAQMRFRGPSHTAGDAERALRFLKLRPLSLLPCLARPRSAYRPAMAQFALLESAR